MSPKNKLVLSKMKRDLILGELKNVVSHLNENQQLGETTLQFHLDNLKSINKFSRLEIFHRNY